MKQYREYIALETFCTALLTMVSNLPSLQPLSGFDELPARQGSAHLATRARFTRIYASSNPDRIAEVRNTISRCGTCGYMGTS